MRLWKVRLAFYGGPYETGEGLARSGAFTLTVRAADETMARQLALIEARETLGSFPLDAPEVWSFEAIELVRRRSAPRLQFFEHGLPLPLPLAELARTLTAEGLTLQIGGASLQTIPETSGQFGVEIGLEEMEPLVRTVGWHAHFDDMAQATACFEWMLTPFYRLVRESQGGHVSASWIERYEDDGWVPLHPVLYRNPTDPTQWLDAAWDREYSQQSVRQLPVSYAEIVPHAVLDDRGFPKGTLLGTFRRTFPRSMAEDMEWLSPSGSFSPGSIAPPFGLE